MVKLQEVIILIDQVVWVDYVKVMLFTLNVVSIEKTPMEKTSVIIQIDCTVAIILVFFERKVLMVLKEIIYPLDYDYG